MVGLKIAKTERIMLNMASICFAYCPKNRHGAAVRQREGLLGVVAKDREQMLISKKKKNCESHTKGQ